MYSYDAIGTILLEYTLANWDAVKETTTYKRSVQEVVNGEHLQGGQTLLELMARLTAKC